MPFTRRWVPPDPLPVLHEKLPVGFAEEKKRYSRVRTAVEIDYDGSPLLDSQEYLYFCPFCMGWIEGEPERNSVDTIRVLSGRRGETENCRRCGFELDFNGGSVMTVLICGSRGWRDARTVRDVIQSLPPDTLVMHGGARGADTLAGHFARERGLQVHVVPAQWDRYGKRAGIVRNERMVRMLRPGQDKVVAFTCHPPTPGTLSMIKLAQEAGFEVEVHKELKR